MTITFVPAKETSAQRRARRAAEREAARRIHDEEKTAIVSMPTTNVPRYGLREDWNWRGPVSVRPPVHRVSTRVLQAAYPFVAGTGAPTKGGLIGENMFKRRGYSLSPWEAYAAGQARSFAVAIFGPPGTGKSMGCKVWANRLLSDGVRFAVPSDPKGEWTVLAEKAQGRTISVKPGGRHVLNLLDPGPDRPDLGREEYTELVLQQRRSTLRKVVGILRGSAGLADVEHTALDLALGEVLTRTDSPTAGAVLDALLEPAPATRALVGDGGRNLYHTLRRLVEGDVRGMFDTQSTIAFDTSVPIMTVDTSGLKYTSKEGQAIATLATSNWIKQAISATKERRVIVHEEAAIGLLADVNSSGSGLDDKTAQEKLGRDDNTSNWYLFHRGSDLDALGDEGSAIRAQAQGLIADTDIRVAFGQTADTVDYVARTLGLNRTQAELTLHFEPGEALFLVGREEADVVRIQPSDDEWHAFKTDTVEREH